MSMQTTIEHKLADAFRPIHMEVVNESGNHNVPPGSETHFKVLLVAEAFVGKTRIARHRLVNKALAEELAGGVHALSVKALAPSQWEAANGRVNLASTPCMHK